MLLVYFSACIRWRAITLTCMHPLHPHRPQRVDSYEYELPADFVDEEIDEDEAFNSEDERLYGHLFSKGNKRGRDGGDDEGDSDDEDDSGSDDDDLLDSEEDSEESGDDEEEDDSELDDVFARAGGESGSEEDADPAEEEGGDEEVYEVIIKGKTYYTSNEKSGVIYGVDENGDVSLEVGVYKDGKPIFK